LYRYEGVNQSKEIADLVKKFPWPLCLCCYPKLTDLSCCNGKVETDFSHDEGQVTGLKIPDTRNRTQQHENAQERNIDV
jgi:hypothetical protein